MASCKLCGEERKLIKAHIIPEFMYHDLYNEDHRFYEFSKQDILDGKTLKPFVQIGEFDKNILCVQCDNERLGSLEKYAQKILFGQNLSNDQTPQCKNYEFEGYEFAECTNVDYLKMKLFLLSILWRSHVTSRPKFDSVDLGPHADVIKDMILNLKADSEMTYPITITDFVRADYDYRDLILEPRRLRTKSGLNSYIFSLGSFQFNFFVNSPNHKLPDFVKEFTLKENNTMRTLHLKNGMANAFIKKLVE